jgi:hypothetical protein
LPLPSHHVPAEKSLLVVDQQNGLRIIDYNYHQWTTADQIDLEHGEAAEWDMGANHVSYKILEYTDIGMYCTDFRLNNGEWYHIINSEDEEDEDGATRGTTVMTRVAGGYSDTPQS